MKRICIAIIVFLMLIPTSYAVSMDDGSADLPAGSTSASDTPPADTPTSPTSISISDLHVVPANLDVSPVTLDAAPLTIDAESGSKIITGILPTSSPVCVQLPFLPQYGDITTLTLTKTVTCLLEDKNEYSYRCPVTWDIADFDSSQTGFHRITGTLCPEESYAFAPDADTQTACNVLVTAPDMDKTQLSAVTVNNMKTNITATDSDPKTLALADSKAICRINTFGEYFTCDIKWNWDEVDTHTPGTYIITGNPILPYGFDLPADYSPLSLPVFVTASNAVDLSAAYIDPQNNNVLTCNWLYTPQNATLQYSLDGVLWQNSAADKYGITQYGTIAYNRTFLTIRLTELTPKITYHFRVLYDVNKSSVENELSNDGITSNQGKLSNELIVSVDNNTNFTYEVGGKGGDWDGGDASGDQIPSHSPSIEIPDINTNIPGAGTTTDNNTNSSSDSGNSSANSSSSTSDNNNSHSGIIDNATAGSAENISNTADGTPALPKNLRTLIIDKISGYLSSAAPNNPSAGNLPMSTSNNEKYFHSEKISPADSSADTRSAQTITQTADIQPIPVPLQTITGSDTNTAVSMQIAEKGSPTSSVPAASDNFRITAAIIIALLSAVGFVLYNRKKLYVCVIKYKKYAVLFCCIFLISVLCIGLNQHDNKYTAMSVPVENGTVTFSQEQISSDTPVYLTRGWEFYPDRLLMPEAISTQTDCMQYVDIGGKNPMSHGLGTYRLTLELPPQNAEYAFELTEVFSVCRLFINDSLMLSLGETGTENTSQSTGKVADSGTYITDSKSADYSDKIGSRIVTFNASGHTEILLAVADYSSVYSGFTYPPAFGNAQAVINHRTTHLLILSALVLLALLGSALALTFGLRSNRKRGLLAFLICISLAGIIGMQLLHSFIITAYQPWYTINAALFYILLMLAVLFQAELCEMGIRRVLAMSLPCLVGIFCVITYFAGASVWTKNIISMFSVVTDVIKWYTAVVLVLLAAWSVWKEKRYSVLLLCGSAGLAACLVWDRLLPLYEPIMGIWFTQAGCLVLTLGIFAFQWADTIEAYKFRLAYQGSFQQMQQRLEMQKEHYHELSGQVSKAQQASHDLRHHMRTMQAMASAGKWQDLNDYLDEYEPHTAELILKIWSENPAADAVLSRYAQEAKRMNAVYDVQLTIPPDFDFPEDELCILLSNLLENACEAISQQKYGQRKIYLRGHVSNNSFGLVVDNTFSGTLHWHEGTLLSTKHEGFGLGLRSVSAIAEKYHGLSDFSANERYDEASESPAEANVFHASLLIPVR